MASLLSYVPQITTFLFWLLVCQRSRFSPIQSATKRISLLTPPICIFVSEQAPIDAPRPPPPTDFYQLDFQSPFPPETSWQCSPVIPDSPKLPHRYYMIASTFSFGHCFIKCDDAPSLIECRVNNCTAISPYTESTLGNTNMSPYGLYECA